MTDGFSHCFVCLPKGKLENMGPHISLKPSTWWSMLNDDILIDDKNEDYKDDEGDDSMLFRR